MLQSGKPDQFAHVLSADSFFFMSPYRSFVTSGCFCRFPYSVADGDGLHRPFQQHLADAFAAARAAGIEHPVIAGAIPFDTRQPSALFIPQHCQFFSRTDKQQSACHSSLPKSFAVVSRREIPQQDSFLSMVEHAARLAVTGDIDKVVLSRLIEITVREPVNSGLLLERLIAQNPESFNFHIPLADGSVLLGASPELLLRKEGRYFSSLPLAGSACRQQNKVLDQQAGNKLVLSAKDRHEHDLVIRAMKAALLPHCEQLTLPDSPQLISTPALWHLATPITGVARDQENALTLACQLHPTPALCGLPYQRAKQLIAELEPFDRELFGGIVGWSDANGDGEWVVAIRCARLDEKQIRLFAGAGIVPGSSPLAEWQETSSKFSTMLNVLGLY